MREVGIDDLQEFEVACLMRVLGKPELDSCVILNEFIMIMENFGVMDQEEDGCDDYLPDTEHSVQSIAVEENKDQKEEKKGEEEKKEESAKPETATSPDKSSTAKK